MSGIYPITTYGATPNNSSNDDAPAFESAVNAAIAAYGGDIFFPSGQTMLKSGFTATKNGAWSPKLNIRGEPGNEIVIASVAGGYLYDFANTNRIDLTDLNFLGQAGGVEVGRFLRSQADQTYIRGLQVAGVNSNICFLELAYNRIGEMSDCAFGGQGASASASPIILLSGYRIFSFRNVQFIDYKNWKPFYLAQTSGNPPSAWVKAPNRFGEELAKISFDNCYFDEGAFFCVDLEQADLIRMVDTNFNGSGQTNAAAGRFADCKTVILDGGVVREGTEATGGTARNGFIFHNCEEVVLKNYELLYPFNKIVLTGTTKRVSIENSKVFDGASRSSVIVVNQSGARVTDNR